MKMAMILKLGLFSVKTGTFLLKRYHTSRHKWRFDPLVSKKIKKFSKIHRHFGIFSELINIFNGIVDADLKNQPALGGTNI
jgi:hypothetical protein|tara:strand:- start:953 stop:1195 length:243 start_codon:yes stop_codon:yes gene_type:complete